jgi:hypothetical protein
MYQPYPTGAEMPETQLRPLPPQVANAVRVMYVGAVASLLGIIVGIVTIGATKTAIEKRSPKLTISQVNASEHALIFGFILGGIVAAVLWVVIARACQDGRNWARITGTVLFAIATIDTLVGASIAPVAAGVRIWYGVVWLIGLAAVVLLWQRASTEYFKAP